MYVVKEFQTKEKESQESQQKKGCDVINSNLKSCKTEEGYAKDTLMMTLDTKKSPVPVEWNSCEKPLILDRKMDGIILKIKLSEEEIDTVYQFQRQNYFEEDFCNRCVDRLTQEIGICNLPYKTLPYETALLKKAFDFWNKIHDRNLDFNSMMDAVIDETEEQLQKIQSKDVTRLDTSISSAVDEMCPHCDTEVTITWDISTQGYEITCPVCGKNLMLCSMCNTNDSGSCDWNNETNMCSKKEPLKKEIV